jgi:SNF2 family DNA or RNA helicase
MEPGLGKTRVAFEAARAATRTLVMAPPNPAELVWPEQRALWAPDLSFRLVRGLPKERERILFDERPQIAVLNYTMLHWFYDTVSRRRKLPYDLLILEEANAVKNPSSIAFRVAKAVEEVFDGAIPMTGTPAENSLHDVWGPLYFVDRGKALGAKIGVFRERFCRAVLRENYVRWQVSRAEELRQAAAPLCFVRRVDDCLDMPRLVFNDVFFDLAPKERRFFDSVNRQGVVPLNDPFVCANTGVAYDKMRQISSGFVYDEERNPHVLGSSKADAMLECLEEAYGSPVFIGFWFSSSKAAIVKALGYAPPCIDRHASMDEKKNLIKRWNRGEIPILLGQIKSVSMGPNMQSPHASILFFDLPWSHGQHFQFIRRVWRYGQSTKVVVRRMIGRGTKDLYVANVLKRKQVDEDDLLEAILNEELI